MIFPVRTAFLAFFLFAFSAAGVRAQEDQPAAATVENLQIGLSTDHIAITSGFAGADLTIFGSLDNADQQVTRQGHYDVIVVLEGPARQVVVRRKDRILGVWVNAKSETFVNVPVSYSMATTRQLQDITPEETYRQLSLGPDYMHLEPANKTMSAATLKEFSDALRQRKLETGLYSVRVAGVQFLSQSLFRATVSLPPNVPVGTHRARAFLFRNGTFVTETSASLEIRKSGFEQKIFEIAHEQALLYGIFAVVLAIVTGWLGRIIFRRD